MQSGEGNFPDQLHRARDQALKGRTSRMVFKLALVTSFDLRRPRYGQGGS